MYCSKCGKEINEQMKVCPYCGKTISTNPKDVPSTAVNIISLCCFPLLGIVLYFVWKDDKPMSAKSALKHSLIGIGIGVIAYFLILILSVSLDDIMRF